MYEGDDCLKQHTMVIIYACLLLTLIGCQPVVSDNQKDTIYTSIYPIQFVTNKIVGDTATVLSVFPPGVDAHTFEPTSRTITNISTSEAFIYLGAHMEGFSDSTAKALQSTDVRFIEIGAYDALFLENRDEHEHGHGDFDPHIWFDPLRMEAMAEIITEQLINQSPEHETLYEKNLATLADELHEVDQAFTDILNQKTNKEIVVTHAAYGYWEDRYGIKQIPISGLTASHEPAQKELVEIVKTAQAHDIEYVLFEQNTSHRVAEIIQKHMNADVLYIHNLEVLTEQDIEKGEDYFSLMRKNLQVLDEATN